MKRLQGGLFFRFHLGSLVCTYRVTLFGRMLYLEGEERMGNHVVYYRSLSLPAVTIFQVRSLVSELAKNRTLPRLMMEKAGESFPQEEAFSN